MGKNGLHYFKHDFNSRNDTKLVNLQMKYGYEGIGIYWSLVEIIYENGGYMELNYDLISFNMRASKEILKYLIEDSNLFIVEGEIFTNQRIKEDINLYQKRVEDGAKWANKRWGKDGTPNGTSNGTPNNDPIQIEKKREEKKREEKNDCVGDFDLLVSYFPNGKNNITHHDLTAWTNLTESDRKLALEMAEPYVKAFQEKGKEQFVKSVSNYIKDLFWIEIRNNKSRYIGSTKVETKDPELVEKMKGWNLYFQLRGEKHPNQIKYEKSLI